jgi:hypothetical protein
MTLKNFGLLCGALAVLGLPVGAGAATEGHVDTDGRCLAVSMVMAGSQEADAKTLGQQAIPYFLGRIEGHPSHGSLQARLAAQFEIFKATPQVLQPTAQGCMKLMGVGSSDFRTAAQYIQQHYGSAPPPAGAAPAPASH